MSNASKLLEFVHKDVCGLMKNISCGGTRYFIIFINDFSKKNHIYLLKAKGEMFDKGEMEIETDIKIKTLWFDNEREFVFKKFDDFLHECGIQ